MTFFIILAVFMAAIIFFHSMQGFFSATLSAIFAVFAAVFAVAYHETVVEQLLGGKAPDEAHALVLLALFAAIYLVLRILFDNLIGGNVRVPSTINRIGAVAMGVVVAIFATGVLAIAAQELPFGISIAGYTRYDVQDDRAVVVPARQAIDSHVFSELTATEPGKFGDPEQGLPFLPVDDILVGAVQKLSTGALSDGKPLSNIHPDLLQELFGQRMGIEAGGEHVAMNLPGKNKQALDVIGLYHRAIPVADQKDSDFPKLRNGAIKPIVLGPTSADMFLVVRVKFTLQAANPKDRIVRFSPGSARLVAYAPNGAAGTPGFVNYYPVGTLQNGTTLYWNKPDDFLFVAEGGTAHGADLVYRVPRKEFEKQAPPGTFIEIKRMARVDLSGMPVDPGPKPDPDFNILRKTAIVPPPAKTAIVPPAPRIAIAPPPPKPAIVPPAPNTAIAPPAPTIPRPQLASSPAASPALMPALKPASPNRVTIRDARVLDVVPAPLSAPAGAANGLVELSGGTAELADGKLVAATIVTNVAEPALPRKVTQFAVPAHQVMVQVTIAPPMNTPWIFLTRPTQFVLLDSKRGSYKPHGVFAEFDAKGVHRYFFHYAQHGVLHGQDSPRGVSPPNSVTLLYLVPSGTNVARFMEPGRWVSRLEVVAK